MVLIPAVAFTILKLIYAALILTGCVSTPGIYLAQLQLPGVLGEGLEGGNNTNSQNVTLRFGYFGMFSTFIKYPECHS